MQHAEESSCCLTLHFVLLSSLLLWSMHLVSTYFVHGRKGRMLSCTRHAPIPGSSLWWFSLSLVCSSAGRTKSILLPCTEKQYVKAELWMTEHSSQCKQMRKLLFNHQWQFKIQRSACGFHFLLILAFSLVPFFWMWTEVTEEIQERSLWRLTWDGLYSWQSVNKLSHNCYTLQHRVLSIHRRAYPCIYIYIYKTLCVCVCTIKTTPSELLWWLRYV